MTVDPATNKTLPRLARFNHAPVSSRQMARASGQPSALFIGTRAGLALALGRLAEIQHLPLTIFWSLQAVAEATLLSADVAIIDAGVWHELQSQQYGHILGEILVGMPIVLVVSEDEQLQLPVELADRVHVVLLPKSSAAIAILQVASRAIKDAASRLAAEEAAQAAMPIPLKLAPQADGLMG